jgi:hypothetical protein
MARSHLANVRNSRPALGGVLSNPASRWPETLGTIAFLRRHPYFLPCGAAALIAFISFSIASVALKEVGYFSVRFTNFRFG